MHQPLRLQIWLVKNSRMNAQLMQLGLDVQSDRVFVVVTQLKHNVLKH